jgi:hypothetical protein
MRTRRLGPHGKMLRSDIEGNKIVVLAVLHAKRDPELFKERASQKNKK